MPDKEQWRPSASFDLIQARAGLLKTIRAFMAERDILEVETPSLSHFNITDPYIDSLVTSISLPDRVQRETVYLHTSPEYCMKRLLAAGSGPVYQICKVFRDDEYGRLHQSEFSLLEWYRPGFNHYDLIEECMELLKVLGKDTCQKVSYQELFHRQTDLDPHTATLDDLRHSAMKLGYDDTQSGRHELLDFIFNRSVVANMNNKAVFVYDYPECMSALAKIRRDKINVVERFELFIAGMEIANGFHELCDAEEQKKRFIQEQSIRDKKDKPVSSLDERFLAALEQGLPDCAGVAVGLDRLLMVLINSQNIEDVLTFPLNRN